jgi:hypothetical protein
VALGERGFFVNFVRFVTVRQVVIPPSEFEGRYVAWRPVCPASAERVEPEDPPRTLRLGVGVRTLLIALA